MVFFTCSFCGESLKKPAVTKHYQTKCRKKEPFLTCVDCHKDFRGNEFEAHTKCLTEEEKYSAKGFVPKPSQNKGERKQQVWSECMQTILKKPTLKPDERDLIRAISKYENVPRKKAKFVNFLSNAFRQYANKNDLIDRVWVEMESLFKEQSEKAKAEFLQQKQANKAVAKTNVKTDDSAGKKDKKRKRQAEDEKAPGKSDSGKHEDKQKKKKQKSNDEKPVEGNSDMLITDDNEREKEKKSRKRKADEDSQTEQNQNHSFADEGEPGKKKKKKKHDKPTENQVNETSQQKKGDEDSKKKNKKQKTAGAETKASTEKSTTGGGDPKKSSGKGAKDNTKSGAVKNVKDSAKSNVQSSNASAKSSNATAKSSNTTAKSSNAAAKGTTGNEKKEKKPKKSENKENVDVKVAVKNAKNDQMASGDNSAPKTKKAKPNTGNAEEKQDQFDWKATILQVLTQEGKNNRIQLPKLQKRVLKLHCQVLNCENSEKKEKKFMKKLKEMQEITMDKDFVVLKS